MLKNAKKGAISCDECNVYESNWSYAEVAKTVYVKNQVNKILVVFHPSLIHSCQPSKPKIRIIKVEKSEHKTKNRNKNLFCVSECHILILLHTLQYNHVKKCFKSPPP